ncbi:hypothetical protein DQ04_03051100 [Trypanosoma grayi]|uniref:hypothetical protein n=1 Tax=Trypanosoma grayi TaxID=71804 RepID=UPI0004F46742|nr:hypothetical protein DQ04_03051100 [Trypanosoma grayi]KEG11026.1 hypothetical protein DQ04_03051100 [Trypanosoma grayi]
MSRADKRQHRDNVVGTSKDAAVRLYAFANTRPGYQLVFSPEQPIIVLKTKKGATEQHPCRQWAPFASLVFSQRPNTTHALYVVDTTALPESMEKEESVTPVVGPLIKRLSNVVARLNPHDATMIAAGVSAPLAFKYAVMGEKMLGHRDRLVRRLILVCPASIGPFQVMLQAVGKRAPVEDYPKPQLVVLLADAVHARGWREWLQEPAIASLLDTWSVTTNLSPTLFAAVAREAGSEADGTAVNLETHYSGPRVFRIDFVLSKATKKTEQHVTLSPLESTGCDDDAAHNNSGTEEDVDENEEEDDDENHEGCGGHCSQECHGHSGAASVFGLATLQHCVHPTSVVAEGRIMDAAMNILGTTQGRVCVHRLRDAAGSLKLAKGQAIRVQSRLQRDEFGRTTLEAMTVVQLTRMQARRSMTICSMGEVPAYNVSATAHAWGALLIRGRKCVLVRSHDGEFDGMRLPFLFHESAEESSVECAMQALCERCDISPDNFYMPSYFPPVCYYDRSLADGITVCVTMHVALAVSPPSGGAGDATEDEESPDEPYDWFSYAKAMRLLQTEAEQEALRDLQRCVRRAHDAGLYVPLKGFGVFGDEVGAAAGVVAAPQSLAGLELLVVCAPGDAEGRAMGIVRKHFGENAVRVGESTPRAEIERAAFAAVRAGARSLVLCITPDVDINLFSEEELTYWSQREVRPRCVTLLLPGVSERIVQQEDGRAAAAFVYDAMISDALLTVDSEMRRFTPPVWGLLRLASKLNSDLALYSGIAPRQPINFPPVAATTTADAEADLCEITIRRTGRPIAAARLAPLLEAEGLQQCYHHAMLLWAQGEVWLASRPHARGVVTLDASSRCLTLEEGDRWEEEEDGEQKGLAARENVITLHVWATQASCAELECAVGAMLDGMLCSSVPTEAESMGDDGLPTWD